MSIKSEFMKRMGEYKETEKKYARLSNKISVVRFVVFIFTLLMTSLYAFQKMKIVALLTLISGLIIFILLIIKHEKIKKQIKKAKCMYDINKCYMDRVAGDYGSFFDCGEEFQNEEHPYTKDLGIFGKNSLFQWINVARTYHGRIRLRDLLCNPDKSIKGIKVRQKAIKEIAEKMTFTENLQYELLMNENIGKSIEVMLLGAEDTDRVFRNKNLQYLFYILPIVTILSILLGFYNFIPIYIGLTLLVIQIVLFGVGSIKISRTLNAVYGFKKHLESYKNILVLIEKEEFEEAYLNEYKSKLRVRKKNVTQCMKELVRISEAIDIKYNAIPYLILNIVFLWDYHCVFLLEKWKDNYGTGIRKWIEVIAEVEALSSLAVIKQIKTQWTFPDFEKNDLIFFAKNMGHPLLGENNCVCNDINIKNNFCIITGSNMSGKTTLLRTIGINLILAYAGAPVYADELKCSVMDVFTSMGIDDDLKNGISTFYAELLRIKSIIDFSKKQLPMIYLIDEIFKGTNSIDRIIGAKSVIRNLNKSWIIGLVSTHDLELCEPNKEVKFENYHFTETYKNGEIEFDYKLKKGRCHTKNAKYLMKMAGIEFEIN